MEVHPQNELLPGGGDCMVSTPRAGFRLFPAGFAPPWLNFPQCLFHSGGNFFPPQIEHPFPGGQNHACHLQKTTNNKYKP
jgi:hypothetical protein